jgi:hypothetical protein
MTRSTQTRQISILDMDTRGIITPREVKPGGEMWLDNTLAGQLYPDLKVALVSVPTGIFELDESAAVVTSMEDISFNGEKYRLVGSGGGAKNGKFYYADEKHAPLLHARFENTPEYLVSYFGIQMSDCRLMLKTEGKILVVPDGVLGTNDCRGWISESLHLKLGAKLGHFYQFRLGWATENGKGSMKVMRDDVADAIGADIIIPESSCKPAPTFPAYTYANRSKRTFTGEFVIGYRMMSQELVFSSSYTVAGHIPLPVIVSETVPMARKGMVDLKEAFRTANHLEVVKTIGRAVSLDDFAEGSDVPEEDTETMRTVEAVLLADGTGQLCQHPYVYQHLNRLLSKYAYKQCTGGGLHLPGFALADDGYLMLGDTGAVLTGSDWIPEDAAFTTLTSKRSLCVRYPVRMMEDLLPMNNCDRDGAVELLKARGLTEQQAAFIADEQLFLTGTYTLHSQTAKKNGGDFDFDQVCLVDEALYPKFVQSRFDHVVKQVTTKNKAKRQKSPMWNLELVALRSTGNSIGQITNLMSSCIAADRMDLMYELVEELQKEIDSLKHAIKADPATIKRIKKLVKKAAWLDLKHAKTIAELLQGTRFGCPSIEEGKPCVCPGGHPLDILSTDRVGTMFNLLREDLYDMIGDVSPIKDYGRLIRSKVAPTKEMLDECQRIYQIYCAGNSLIRLSLDKKLAIVKLAEIEFTAAKSSDHKERIRNARSSLALARAEVRLTEDKNKASVGRLINIMAGWGLSKEANRDQWAAAVNTVVCNGNGNGSLLFHTFPQEAVDAIAIRTGGIRTIVDTKWVSGITILRGDVLCTARFDGTGETPLFRYDPATSKLAKVA